MQTNMKKHFSFNSRVQIPGLVAWCCTIEKFIEHADKDKEEKKHDETLTFN